MKKYPNDLYSDIQIFVLVCVNLDFGIIKFSVSCNFLSSFHKGSFSKSSSRQKIYLMRKKASYTCFCNEVQRYTARIFHESVVKNDSFNYDKAKEARGSSLKYYKTMALLT